MSARSLFCFGRRRSSWFKFTSNLIPGSSSTCHKHERSCSMLKKSFLTDLSLDLDINAMKEEKIARDIGIHQIMNEKLEQRCSEVIGRFSAKQTRILKIIQLEHDFMYAQGFKIPAPDMMTNIHWIEALTLSSKQDRIYYYYDLQQKEEIRAKKDMELERNPEPLGYQETDKSFMPYNTSKLVSDGNHSLSSAMTHGIPLVFDFGFEDWMGPKELSQTCQQLWDAYAANRAHPNPFHFIFTNCGKRNILYRTLEIKHLLDCEHFLVTETEKSYLDVYDRSQLVYLSAYSKQEMTHFDPSRVYIIGAYADTRSSLKFGPGKAKEQGIECMKLPIDFHLRWQSGSKDLLLPWVVQTLLSVKHTGDWKEAFSTALPSKNYRGFRDR